MGKDSSGYLSTFDRYGGGKTKDYKKKDKDSGKKKKKDSEKLSKKCCVSKSQFMDVTKRLTFLETSVKNLREIIGEQPTDVSTELDAMRIRAAEITTAQKEIHNALKNLGRRVGAVEKEIRQVDAPTEE